MESSKTVRLVLVIESLALLIGALLILIDYKIKNDLVVLFKRIENALESGQKLFGTYVDTASDPDRVRTSDMVGNAASMETAPSLGEASQNGKPRTATRRSTSAKRNGGNGDTPVPRPSDSVGP